MISEGYEPVFIDIQTHIKLWDFIDYYIDTVNAEIDTILNYLNYCYSSGINSNLLSEYSDIIINDLYAIYMKDEKLGDKDHE